jgi:hypothetical protein
VEPDSDLVVSEAVSMRAARRDDNEQSLLADDFDDMHIRNRSPEVARWEIVSWIVGVIIAMGFIAFLAYLWQHR